VPCCTAHVLGIMPHAQGKVLLWGVCRVLMAVVVATTFGAGKCIFMVSL
jgi:hypothetical protein